jgi:hypothetical protein
MVARAQRRVPGRGRGFRSRRGGAPSIRSWRQKPPPRAFGLMCTTGKDDLVNARRFRPRSTGLSPRLCLRCPACGLATGDLGEPPQAGLHVLVQVGAQVTDPEQQPQR